MMESNADFSPADQEERRRVFWSLYLLDRIVSCGRGRPPAILEASCQLQLPCDDKAWKEGRPQITNTFDQLSNKPLLNEKDLSPFALVVIMAYVLSRAAQYMLQQYNIRSRDPPWDPSSDFALISSDLLYMESRFDLLELKRSTTGLLASAMSDGDTTGRSSASLLVYSRALFYLCHCLLNHPFLLRYRLEAGNTQAPPTFLVRSFDSGRVYAERLTRHINDAWSAGCPMNASFYGYCSVVAGSIQGLYLHSTDENLRQEAAQCVQLNLATLKEIGKFWENVSVMVPVPCPGMIKHLSTNS